MTVLSGSGPHRIPKFLGEKLLWQREKSLSRREDGGVQPTLLGDLCLREYSQEETPFSRMEQSFADSFRRHAEQDALLGGARFSCCQNIAKIPFLSNKNENNNMQILFPFSQT